MLLENTVLYEKHHLVEINSPEDKFFYFFDYDERSYTINMEFQHFHRFYEFCIFLDQSANHLIEGDIYDLQFGDIVAIKPSILHKTQYPHGAPKKRLIINFLFPVDTDYLSGDLKNLLTIFDGSVPIYRFTGMYRDQIFQILNEIFRLTKQRQATEHASYTEQRPTAERLAEPQPAASYPKSNHSSIHTLLIHMKFLEFLTKLYLFRDQNTYVVHSSVDNLTHKVYSITSYIHEHYMDDLTLEFLAKKFYISRYYLSHQFKNITGFTLNNYIQMTKIRNTQQLLLTTDRNITAIAEECGFSSFSQFNRTFNKYCGMSPSKYRASKGSMASFSFVNTE
ncbi:AraC-like DNA-binding protein [Anaerotaenia torta]|uniref:AraC family transcriptional regulator n=1 Tax=Anaerotaenia torta TaxID=433293 RepID=UPI003D1E9FCE